ncbi:MAG: hypothetical protein RSD40_00690 [Bacilli bacterium]|jgi:hypothetical protein|nr:hypothetical protein [Bacilli bacterium]
MMLKKFRKRWIRFWGSWFRVIKDDKELAEILIYHKRIYILKTKEMEDIK